jgi:hypothetical protein
VGAGALPMCGVAMYAPFHMSKALNDECNLTDRINQTRNARICALLCVFRENGLQKKRLQIHLKHEIGSLSEHSIVKVNSDSQ